MADLKIRNTGSPVGLTGQTNSRGEAGTDPTGFQSRSASSRSIGPSPITPSNALDEGFNQLGNVYSDSRQRPTPPNAGLRQSASPSQRSEREEIQDIFSELMTGTEHEIAFLVRHYSETLGPWYVPLTMYHLSMHADWTGWISPTPTSSSGLLYPSGRSMTRSSDLPLPLFLPNILVA